ncbi:MAG: ATP-binding cassette domain-containing protein [Actinomycetales bacterium]|nr:ATP-binding cassette domain-containing protein [Actinomycetales bacterium]
MIAVRARGWGWRYAARRAWAVRGLDLDLEPGQRVLLLGASGAGKSTVLAGLAGLLDPGTGPDGSGRGSVDGTGEEEGALLLDGVPVRRARADGVREGHARTGLLLQDPLTQTILARCGDDVAFGLENHAVDREEIWRRVEVALRWVRFPYGVDHPTSRLSGGERQRLALAGVLALRPGLLLLDEPTAMLDPDGAALLRERVGEILDSTGATCVLVEHRVGQWLPVVDRVVVLEPGGGAVADGSPREVFAGHGTRLAEAGIWVPGVPFRPDRRADDDRRADVGRPDVGRPEAGSRAEPDRPADVGSDPENGPLLAARALAASPEPWVRRSRRSRREAESVRPAVRDVSLDLSPGTVLCVVGPNGAGKSTLALALAGLVAPVAGEVRAEPGLAVVDGHDAGPHPRRWRPRELVRRIGTVFQDPQHQFVATTVADELAVGPRRLGLDPAEVTARVDDLLERLGLAHLARANPFTLSGGEQRRLSVATALATRPRVLVLDEPTFGQDARTWAELVRLLLGTVRSGVAVVVVTHDEPLVEELVAHGGATVLRLRDGRPVPGAGAPGDPRPPHGDAAPSATPRRPDRAAAAGQPVDGSRIPAGEAR